MDEFERIIYMDQLKTELEETGEISLPPLQMYPVPQSVIDAFKGE